MLRLKPMDNETMKRGWTLAGVGCVATLSIALAQDGGVQAVIGNVFLQNTTPGTVQAGHASIGGTFRAGQVFVQQTNSSTTPIVGNNNATGIGLSMGGSFSAAQRGSIALRGTATSNTGEAIGVQGVSRADEGAGLFGICSATTGPGSGVIGFTATTTGSGVRGHALKTTGSNFGVTGVSASSAGRGVLGECPKGVGVEGQADTGVGVQAIATGIGGSALRAVTIADGPETFAGEFRGGAMTLFSFSVPSNGATFAVIGQVASSGGTGVLGVTPDTGTSIGVHGRGNSPTGFGVFSTGRFGATGTKNFVIDHPLDPENRYLMHYSAEGPEPRNVYMGRVTTDARGYAWIDLPSYYASINRDPEYLLTVLDSSDDFILAKVTREIEDKRFQIRTSKGGVKVSWRVDAIRNDRWVRRNNIPVEPAKPSEFRGTYLQPDLYGKPESYGQNAPKTNGRSSSKP